MNTIRYILVICWLLTGVFAEAQEADISYAKHVVKKLASPGFNGRGYRKDGDKKAAAFIAKELKKQGIAPLFGDSYYQPFELGANTFSGKLRVSLNEKNLKPGVDFLVWPGSPAVKGQFPVKVIKRSDLYGTLSDALQYADRTHYLLIDNRKEPGEAKELAEQANAAILYLRNADELSLPGVILYDNTKLTWSSQTKPSARPVVFVNQPSVDPMTVTSIALDVESVWTPDYETQNVAGIIPGTTTPDSLIVVCAHYDHLGRMGKKNYVPGANDNASGTAFILDLARYYATNPSAYTLVFIAFSGEESGLLGSKAFVKNPPFDLSDIKFLINFDMVGTGEDGMTVVNAPMFPEAFNKLTAINNDKNYLKAINSRGESCNSDHCPFYEKGVPSFFIYTQGGIAAYHDINDRYETLPFTAFANLKQLIIDFVD